MLLWFLSWNSKFTSHKLIFCSSEFFSQNWVYVSQFCFYLFLFLIKIKGYCDFLSHNSDFFLRIASLYFAVLNVYLTILSLQLAMAFFRIWSLHLAILTPQNNNKNNLIVTFIQQFWLFIVHSSELICHNSEIWIIWDINSVTFFICLFCGINRLPYKCYYVKGAQMAFYLWCILFHNFIEK